MNGPAGTGTTAGVEGRVVPAPPVWAQAASGARSASAPALRTTARRVIARMGGVIPGPPGTEHVA